MKCENYKQRLFAIITTLGVVYGDIGTSPLYAIKECFSGARMVLTHANILGVLSLVFWTLTSVVTFKYIFIVLRANSNGEGGVLALLSLVRLQKIRFVPYRYLVLLGFLGVALFFGDTSITPAISILSALEGIHTITPALDLFIVPASIVVVVILFCIQSHGTDKIGGLFGPIMLLWFLSIGIFGFLSIMRHPEVLYAINPMYAVNLAVHSTRQTLVMMGFLVLCITGAEALYADMGHFGPKLIRVSWLYVVFPCLICNYFGQGAELLSNVKSVTNPFYSIIPVFAKPFVIILATVSTAIASQSVISGLFSLCRQASQIGYLPRMRIIHTSAKQIGQIYIPAINWIMFFMVCVVIILFKKSDRLAEAYGLAASGVMLVTSIFALIATLRVFKWQPFFVYGVFSLFIGIDCVFLYANSLKLISGGWFPLLVSSTVFFVMYVWDKQYSHMNEKIYKYSVGFNKFFDEYEIASIQRVAGTGIFLSQDANHAPLSIIKHIEHNKCLPKKVIILSIISHMVPKIQKNERLVIERLAHKNFVHIIANFGFMQTPRVTRVLREAQAEGVEIDIHSCTYYLLNAVPSLPAKMRGVRGFGARIFRFLLRNTTSVWYFFDIPYQRVLEMGILVKVLDE